MDAQTAKPLARSPRNRVVSHPAGALACGRAMAHGCWVAAMAADTLLLAALPAIAGFIALPAFAALCRRRATREASQVAAALAEFAAAARRDLKRTQRCQPLDADLSARVQRLRVPEFVSLQLVHDLPQDTPGIAGGHRAASGAAAQAARRLRTQDAGAHGLGSASRRGRGDHSAAAAPGAARLRVVGSVRSCWRSSRASKRSAAGCCGDWLGVGV